MSMNKKKIPGLVLAAIILAAPAVGSATVITGSLTDDDFLAIDTVGPFYYDVFDVTALDAGSVSISLESDDFAPYLAYGFGTGLPPWPTGSDVPYTMFDDAFCLGAPGGSTLNAGSPGAGQTFQVIVATCQYNPTPLGGYVLTIDGNVDVLQLATIPEPGTLLLMGLGLAGVGLARRRTGRRS